MKKILFATSVLVFNMGMYCQTFDQTKKAKKEVSNAEETTFMVPVGQTLPVRTTKPVTPKDQWKPLPQFQVGETVDQHWYALENIGNVQYWQNVMVDRLFVCLKKGSGVQEIQSLIDKYSLTPTNDKSMFPEIMNFYVYKIPNSSKEKMIDIVKSAQSYSTIMFAEPEPIITSMSCMSNDPYYSNPQWGAYNIWADSAWCYETGNNTWQMVAIIDNACDYYHPDLYNTVWYGYDFADLDNDPTPVNTSVDHGTHVSGISSAEINNGIGMSGMANDTAYFAKVTDDATATISNTAVLNAINFFSGQSRIRVINMSFGGTSVNSAQQTACQNAYNNGKLLIAAAGNYGNNIPLYPAAYSSVIAVGAVDIGYNVASYSNYGNYLEVTAPGGDGLPSDAGDMLSTLPNNSYGYKPGTSMAAPIVTGLAGLMFAANPSLTNIQARTILQQCVWDYGSAGWDQYYGYGVVNAYCAVISAMVLTSTSENGQPSLTISLFPNPTNNSVTVLTANIGGVTNLSIVNAIGQEVFYKSNISEVEKIDISNIPNGTYFVIIHSESQGHFHKILTKIN